LNYEILIIILGAAVFIALFVLLDRGADALRAKYGDRIPEGGLVGLLWRKITGAKE
jgi:hypothetical protein